MRQLRHAAEHGRANSLRAAGPSGPQLVAAARAAGPSGHSLDAAARAAGSQLVAAARTGQPTAPADFVRPRLGGAGGAAGRG